MGVNLPQDLQNLDAGVRMGDVKGLADGIANEDYKTTANAVTASTTQTQVGGTVIRAAVSRITTAASGDAITLGFSASAGRSFEIINDTGQSIALFPKSGDKLNDAATNASVSLADNTISYYSCPVAGLWFGGATTFET